MTSIGTQDWGIALHRREYSRSVLAFVVVALASLLAPEIGFAEPGQTVESDVLAPAAAAAELKIAGDPSPGGGVSGAIAQAPNPANPALVGLMIEIGRRWTYVFKSERTSTVAGGEPEVEKLHGTRVDEITGLAPELGEGVVRMLSSSRGRSASSPNELNEVRAGFYRAAGASLQLVAEQASDPTAGLAPLVQYEAPLSVLEAAATPGQRWSVGVRSERDLHTSLEGEVLGVQDVQTPYGLFERCLVIRLTGQISGVIEAYGSRMEVPSGDFSVTQWYAPGVGLVLAKEEISQTLVLEDGKSMDYSERSQFALRSTESTTAAAPASGER
ncbi:MAG: hypothetical protein JRE71_04780 [Deltaproteobacteria bacterium]|nr:hypothetical protein [Deltaproteobacteria bacterium]